MKKALRVLKTVCKAILAAVMGILLLYNVYLLIARTAFGNGMPTVFGYAVAVVASGSMEPTFGTSDCIVIHAEKDYAAGDVITFYDDVRGEYVTHRIVLASEGMFATQGDANDSPDAFSVPQSAVVGKVVYVLRGAGGVVRFLQSPAGLLAVFGGGVLLWVAMDLISERERKKSDA